jgi:mono/diheme cytochrome c family protein
VLVAILCAVATAGLAGCGGGGDGPPVTTGAEPAGNATAGADVWGDAGCGSCHTLQAADSSGTVGPNLDELRPAYDTVIAQVTNGGGGMPAFEGTLTEQEIMDVAAFVVESTQG